LVLIAAMGCTAAAPPGPPVVALITIDTWRADHFSAEHTPHLWRRAKGGERYTNAWTPMGLTSPAHATMLTGKLPWEHGLRANNHHGFALADVQTVPERHPEQARGAFVSAYPAGPEGGLSRGWEVFEGPESGERGGEAAVAAALAWLPDDRPSLLWVHVYEPHGPYVGTGRTDAERYAEEVRRADALLEPLLDALDARRARVVLAGDHGEVHDEERCGWQHERSTHDAVLRVPLARWGPGVDAREITHLVGLADVPALLEGAAVAPRAVWLAESGICEPGCTPGCTPTGVAGRERIAVGDAGRLVLGSSGAVARIGRPDPGWVGLLREIPAVPEPGQAPDEEGLRELGYLP